MEDKCYCHKVSLYRPNSVPALSLVIMVVFLLLVQERGEEIPSQKKNYVLLLGR